MSPMNRYMLPALLALNAGLAVALTYVWVRPDGQLRNVRWDAPHAQTTDYAAMLPNLPTVKPLNTGEFMAQLERPLFSITRRPPPPPPPPKAAEAPPPPDTLSTARLTGVYSGQGAGGVIVNIAGKDRRVRIREQVEGWTLSAIDLRGATFTSGTASRTLPLQKGKLTNFAGDPAALSPPPPPSPSSPAPAAAPTAVQAVPADAPAAAASPAPGAPPRPRPVFGGSIR